MRVNKWSIGHKLSVEIVKYVGWFGSSKQMETARSCGMGTTNLSLLNLSNIKNLQNPLR